MAALVESMAYAMSGGVPWHGKGVPVSDDMTPVQILEKAGLNWNVEKVPLYGEFHSKSGQRNYTADHHLLVRDSDGEVLSEVTEMWEPCQNLEAFEFFDSFVKAGEMTMETAISLKGGKYVIALAKIKDSFTLFGHDKIDAYMLFANPHMFGHIINVRFTPIRVVCNNTFVMALRGAENSPEVRLTHRRKFDGERVKELLGFTHQQMETYKEWGEFLGSAQVSGHNDLAKYFSALFPVVSRTEDSVKELSKGAQKCLEIFETQPGAEFANGSYWQALQAAFFYIDHIKGKNIDTRLESSWFGDGCKVKVKAGRKALMMASGQE